MRKLRTRQGRADTGAFVVEGPLGLSEALDFNAGLQVIYLTPDALSHWPGIGEVCRTSGLNLVIVSEAVMDAMSETRSPQGALGVCTVPNHSVADVFRQPGRSIVILENMSDPGNVGTIIRTADAAGAAGVILLGDSVDPYNGKCVRATVGSIFHLPVTSISEAPPVITTARAKGYTVVVGMADGEQDLFDWVDSSTSKQATAWIFGSEAHGVSDSMKAEADVRVRIPMYGAAESLNVASAAAVCLYAEAHHRHERIGASP